MNESQADGDSPALGENILPMVTHTHTHTCKRAQTRIHKQATTNTYAEDVNSYLSFCLRMNSYFWSRTGLKLAKQSLTVETQIEIRTKPQVSDRYRVIIC